MGGGGSGKVTNEVVFVQVMAEEKTEDDIGEIVAKFDLHKSESESQ